MEVSLKELLESITLYNSNGVDLDAIKKAYELANKLSLK